MKPNPEIGVQKRHPFSFTIGEGPYQYIGSYDLGRAVAAVSNGSKDSASAFQDAPRLESGMGTCSHCGHPILNIQIIRRGDGKLYGIGSDCVLKVAAEGDVSAISEMEKNIRRDIKRRKEEKENALRASLEPEFESALIVLASKPHPNEYYAGQGKTAADYYNFCSKNSRNMKAAIKESKS